MDLAAHVITQLDSQAGRLNPDKKDDYVKICCPYHGGGRERTPSCSVNLREANGPVGYFYCFGCKDKGSWNRLADTLGLQGFKARDRVNDVFSFSFVAEAEDAQEQKVPRINDFEGLARWRRHSTWRTIHGNVVRKYGGVAPPERYPGDWLTGENFIYFPVWINDKNVGGVYARRVVTRATKEAGSPSYINTAGRWTKQYVFGYNQARLRRRQPLWVVEGPRDAMKIWQMGGRAVAFLGAYVSKSKLRLIEALDPPSLINAMDPDEAGERARRELRLGLPMMPQDDAHFPEGRDAGNFRQASYDRMMKRMGYDPYR